MTYIFVGSNAEVVGTPYVFSEFGQVVELEPAVAEKLVLEHGVHLIPQSAFTGDRAEAWRAHNEFKKSLIERPVAPAEETNV